MYRILKLVLPVLLLLGSSTAASAASAEELQKLRVGVLKFGTVNWEMDTLQHHKLAQKHGFVLEVTGLASADASTVALQGGAVDVIVSDFVWVARQRASGQNLSLVPYSHALGAVMVPADSPIKTLVDLKGKKLGIAGGANDKSWLLLRAFAEKSLGLDLDASVKKQFAAPPLLNELVKRKELDAVLNFWPFASRLQADGMRTLISVPEVLQGLGIKPDLPLLGWVFSETFATENPALMRAFIAASYDAKAILRVDDAEWQRLRPLMKAENDAVFEALRSAFRSGIPTCFGEPEKRAAADSFKLLADIGGKALVGSASSLDTALFWGGQHLPECLQ